MSSGKKYIILEGGKTKLSDVVNDCNLNLCVDAKQGEPLSSILQRLCRQIKKNEGIYIEAGENIVIDGSGSQNNPYIVSATFPLASIGVTMPEGFAVVNSPLTKSGVINVTSSLDGIIRGTAGGFATVTIGNGLKYDNGILSSLLTNGDGITFDGIRFSHANTSDIPNITFTGTEVPGTITFDEFGHAKLISKRNLTIADFNLEGDITEIAQDAITQMLTSGNHPNVNFVYNDAENKLDVLLTLDVNSVYTPVQTLLQQGSGIVLNKDANNKTVTIGVSNSYIRSLFSDDGVVTYDPTSGVIGLEQAFKDKVNDTYNDSIVGISVSGSINKTITLTSRDGSTLTASFTDLAGANNNYPTSLNFTAGQLTLGIQGMPSLSTFIPLAQLADVNLTSPVTGQMLRYNASIQKWENWTPNFLTTFTEVDPVFKSSPAYYISNTDINNWNNTFQKTIKSANVAGTTSKVINIVLQDGSIIAAPFTDLTGTNNFLTDAYFDALTGNVTLSMSEGNDIIFSLDGRYLQSYTETDPIFVASPAHTITSGDILHWKDAYNNTITGLYVTGTTTKTITLVQRDGGTISAVFQDLIGGGGSGDGDCIGDGNNYVTNIVMNDDGNFVLSRFGMSDLTTTISLHRLLDVDILTPACGDVLLYNCNTGTWENKVAPWLTSFTEVDPIANAKVITLNQGTGIVVTGNSGQALGSQPSWSVSLDKNYTDTLYVPLSRKISINGIEQNLSADRAWNLTTTNIAEGTNLYFTNPRVWAAISANAPISFTGGVISHLTSGVAQGTYNSVTVDTFGHVISASNVPYLTTAAIATLTDVTLSELQNGQFLQYDAISARWKNVSFTTPEDTNFARTNLIADGNRVHDFEGYSLDIIDLGSFAFNTAKTGFSSSYISSTINTDTTLALGVTNNASDSTVFSMTKTNIAINAVSAASSSSIAVGDASINLSQSSGNYIINNITTGDNTDTLLTISNANKIRKVPFTSFLSSNDPRIENWNTSSGNEIIAVNVQEVTTLTRKIILTQKDGGELTADFAVNASGSSSYTDENAQDAVGAALESTPSVLAEYDDDANKIKLSVKDSYLLSKFQKIEVRLRVGVENNPQIGDSSFILADCDGNAITGKKLQLYRERALQWQGDDFTYDLSTGLITVNVAFKPNERLVIVAENFFAWQLCDLSGGDVVVPPDASLEFSDEFNLTEFN